MFTNPCRVANDLTLFSYTLINHNFETAKVTVQK